MKEALTGTDVNLKAVPKYDLFPDGKCHLVDMPLLQ